MADWYVAAVSIAHSTQLTTVLSAVLSIAHSTKLSNIWQGTVLHYKHRPSCQVTHELQGEEVLLSCTAEANPEVKSESYSCKGSSLNLDNSVNS